MLEREDGHRITLLAGRFLFRDKKKTRFYVYSRRSSTDRKPLEIDERALVASRFRGRVLRTDLTVTRTLYSPQV